MTTHRRGHRILVTGGGGYLGSVLVRQLLEHGHWVTVVDNFAWGQQSLMDCCAFTDFEVVRSDVRDERIIPRLVRDHDVIIPLAALVGAPLCDRDCIAAETTIVGGVKLLLEHASRAQRFLYPATNSGYGVGEGGKHCTEESRLSPASLYGRLKVEAERLVLERTNALSFRLATVFGASPRMRRDLLVNDFVYRAVHDRAVVVFEGHFKRNYIHVRDVARAFLHGIDHFDILKGRPYNVGLDDANLSKIELCEVIKRCVPSFIYVEAPFGEDPDKRDYIISNARIASTGYRTEWSLERGICELVKCYTILPRSLFANA
jgi:nucleoside-diphosphate-sugar epimerase